MYGCPAEQKLYKIISITGILLVGLETRYGVERWFFVKIKNTKYFVTEEFRLLKRFYKIDVRIDHRYLIHQSRINVIVFSWLSSSKLYQYRNSQYKCSAGNYYWKRKVCKRLKITEVKLILVLSVIRILYF